MRLVSLIFWILSIGAAAAAPTNDIVVTYPTHAAIAALVQAGAPTISQAGYAAAGDGGFATYDWNPASLPTADGVTVILPTGQSSGTQGRILRANGALDPRVFGAKCDGATDDHAALAAWASALSAATAGLLSGDCRTSTAIAFPDLSGIVIAGAMGATKARLTYTGATTTGDIFTFGGSTQVSNLLLKDIGFETATVMTSGALVHVKNIVNSEMRGISEGLNTNNAFTGLWLDGAGLFIVSGEYVFNGSANDVLVSGGPGDIWFKGGGQLENGAGIGLHIAGGVPGFNFLSGDVLGNAQSLVIDESVTGTTNQQLNFGPHAFFDISTSTSKPNVELVASGSAIQDLVTFNGSWVASSGIGQPCAQIDSGFAGYVNFEGGEIANCNAYGVIIQSATANINFSGTYFLTVGGGGIYNSGSNPNVTTAGLNFLGVSNWDYWGTVPNSNIYGTLNINPPNNAGSAQINLNSLTNQNASVNFYNNTTKEWIAGLSGGASNLWSLYDNPNAAYPFQAAPGGNLTLGETSTNVHTINGYVKLQAVAIASLPSCAAGTVGEIAFVNNGIAAPTYHQAVSATGSAEWPVSCSYNGTSYGWVY